jgi:hypothetical protein
VTATVLRDGIKRTLFCTSARSLGDREVVFISVGLRCAVPIPSKGKHSVFSPCLTLIKPSTLCTHHLFRETVFTFVIQLHKYRPSLPGTSAPLFTCTQSSDVICAVKLVAPFCSRRPYRSLIFREVGCAVLFVSKVRDFRVVGEHGWCSRKKNHVCCVLFLLLGVLEPYLSARGL